MRNIVIFVCLTIQLGLLYFNLNYWGLVWLSWFLFVVYFLFTGLFWQSVFKKVFGMKYNNWITRLYSYFTVFLILGFISSMWVVWYKITPFILWTVFVDTAILSFFISFLCRKKATSLSLNYSTNIEWGEKYDNFKKILMKSNVFLLVGFLALWFIAIYLLIESQGLSVINTPWKAISPYFLPVFFLITVFLGFILFTKHKIKLILFFVVLHSILLHLYLPLSHQMPWGGDVWRHIAIEQKLLDGEVHPPVIFGEEAKWREVLNIDIPEAFIIPNKYIYGQFWGSTVLLSRTLQIDLITLNKWLIPVLWSIMLPLIFFRIGRLLFASWRKALFLSVLPCIAFPFQVLGAITLPVSLGYLVFFFVLMLMLQYLRDEKVVQKRIVIFFAFLMAFGYTLHFILIWLVIFLSFLLKNFYKDDSEIVKPNEKRLKYAFIIILSIFSLGFFPLFEILTKTSRFDYLLDCVLGFKQLLVQFSGWSFVHSLKPYDILTGNIIFNHTPDYASVSNFFTMWRWYMLPFMFVLWGSVFYAFWISKNARIKSQWLVLKLLFASVLGGYIINWFFLVGDRSFVRRLDAMVAFFIIVFLSFAFFHLTKRKIKPYITKPLILLIIFSFALITTTSYASGPDMRVVSTGEYKVGEYIVDNASEHCVLADTWVLLVVEGLSAHKIVGGGFPIDYQFAQPDRVRFFNEIKKSGSENVLQEMYNATGFERCLIVMPRDVLSEEEKENISNLVESEANLVGEFFVWESYFEPAN
jgi:hypothetical protein